MRSWRPSAPPPQRPRSRHGRHPPRSHRIARASIEISEAPSFYPSVGAWSISHLCKAPTIRAGLFHVKHGTNAGAVPGLFADAKIPEDHVQDIFHVDAAEELAQGPRRQPQLLGHDLLAAVLRGMLRALQSNSRFLEMRALALTRYQRRLGCEEPVGKAGKGVNQFIDPDRGQAG